MRDKRCGRLGRHPEHEWTAPARITCGVVIPARHYHCNGHVITALAERQWASNQDAEDAADDMRRVWERDREALS